jgi:hypothetical protein
MEVCIIKNIRALHEITNYNSKGHLNMTHFKEKIHILLQGVFYKDDVKVIVPNETPMTLILLDGVANWDGVLKSSGRP